jgi:uncharacterized protein YndB with AHSA1/START domain
MVGTYRVIVPPDKLVFTFWSDALPGPETDVMVEFFDQGGGTEMVLTHTGLMTPATRVLLGSGGPTLLDALAAFLASPADG